MKVSDIMIENPITLSKGDSIHFARELLYERGMTHVPVVDNEVLIGIVTKEDLASRFLILMANGIQNLSVDQYTIGDIMSEHPKVVLLNECAQSIAKKYEQSNSNTIVVVDGSKKVRGILNNFHIWTLLNSENSILNFLS